MLGIFEAIIDFFASIFQIIGFVFRALYLLFKLLFSALGFLLDLFSLLPTPILVCGTLLVVVCITYKILGRESQS